ncbi:MAG: ATP-binding protein [Actinobacteria bacterium]|nr:ATP-binding protein [Actinomycetota bacterium]
MIPHTIRFRLTLVAGALAALVLAVAGVVIVLLQRGAMTASLDQALTHRADDITSLLRDGERPDRFSLSGAEGFVQLVDGDGLVVASTPNLEGEPPLRLSSNPGTETIQTMKVVEVDDDLFRVLSRPVGGGTLLVGTTYDVVTESTTTLAVALALTIPAVIVLLAALVWWLVGRTLRPVEDIRTEVASISTTDLHRRVPQPGTDDEIDRLATTMNQMLERLQSSVERQLRFVADASHELRSPLTRLRADIELGLAAALLEPTGDRLRTLLNEVIGLQTLVEDLLYLARADASDTLETRGPLDLDDLVFDEARAIDASGRVEVSLSEVSGAHVTGDRSQLRRAVRNLLQNAERHATSRVFLSLGEVDGYAVLTVADDGPGVPPSGSEHIFERFGRLDQSRTAQTGGVGLGLAIARDIVERHGGELSLSNPGEPGARFEMRVPLVGRD